MNNGSQNLPERAKYRPQKPSGCHFKGQRPQYQPCEICCPDIPAADRKGQIQAEPECPCQKKEIREHCVLRPQGTKKSIKHPQSAAQQKADAKSLGCQRRCYHPSIRPSQLLCCRGSS